MEIGEETIKETTHCHKDFECIKNNNICCNVTHSVNKQVHFVECKERVQCNYKMSFGNSFICTCPTRKEIYNKYGI
jgi:hypothetical protein